MEKALVIGASGGMGYSIVKELSSRGIQVTAFARNAAKLKKLFDDDRQVKIMQGDVLNAEQLQEATEGNEIIYNAINIPYGDWKKQLLPLTQNVLEIAKTTGAKLAVVDNIYCYGFSNGELVNEQAPKNPHTIKGKIRLEMGRLIADSGVSYVIVHFPDFYGPQVENGQLNYTLNQIVANRKAGFVGNPHIAREHIYTPDGAKAMVELSLREEAYNQHWNIPATTPITGTELIRIIKEITGYRKSVSTITKNMIRLVGLVDRQMREFVEMQYLNQHPVVLDGSKYEEIIGPLPRTPYREGLQQTIAYMESELVSAS